MRFRVNRFFSALSEFRPAFGIQLQSKAFSALRPRRELLTALALLVHVVSFC